MRTLRGLAAADRRAVEALVAQAAAHDGIAALNDDARLNLTGGSSPGVAHVLAGDTGDLIGYAQRDQHGSGYVVVHPHHRHRGHGRALLGALPGSAWWAFGDSPDARTLASAAGLQPTRTLLHFTRPLAASVPIGGAPAGVTVRAWTPADTHAVLTLNAAAFADHPEQGALTRAEFDARTREPWFNPAGLLLAYHGNDLWGFHWTKREGTAGEVYVIATAPAAQGRGVGRHLLLAGLAHLHARGATSANLFVEASAAPALALYRSIEFDLDRTDVQYTKRREEGHEHRRSA